MMNGVWTEYPVSHRHFKRIMNNAENVYEILKGHLCTFVLPFAKYLNLIIECI